MAIRCGHYPGVMKQQYEGRELNSQLQQLSVGGMRFPVRRHQPDLGTRFPATSPSTSCVPWPPYWSRGYSGRKAVLGGTARKPYF